jgi:hypothetical protein
MHYERRSGLFIAAFTLLTLLACTLSVGEMSISLGPPSPTPTNTRTPRPTLTLIPSPTDTLIPTNTPTPLSTATATRRPVTSTARPPTPRPTAAGPQPTAASTYEFHANPPLPCAHSGLSYFKGTVYLNRSDPNSKYVGAIVALGPPNGSTIYDIVKTNDYGEYTFVLGGNGEAKPGYWGIWLVDPSMKRKSDIGGPIQTNDLPAENPNSCWTSGVDFWK